MTTAAVQECLARVHNLFSEADEIEKMCKQCEHIIDLLFKLYNDQNDAIGRFAREKGLADDHPLATLEDLWISDSDGVDRFYSEFREKHPVEYDEIRKRFDFFVFMLLQMLWKCDPTHLYLLEKRLGHTVGAADLSLFSDDPKDPEAGALRNLRRRLKPFVEETME